MQNLRRSSRLFTLLCAFVLTALLFARANATHAQNNPLNGITNAALFVQEYFATLSRADYATAYAAWETPPPNQTLAQFSQGYANTARIAAFVRLPIFYEGAAGSLYAQVPALIVGVQRDGTQQVFSGCYTLREQNAGVNPAPLAAASGWRLYSASIAPRTTADLAQLTSACAQNAAFGGNNTALYGQEELSDLVSGYYDLIARGDFANAYARWETPPSNQTLDQFTTGFANTGTIQAYLRLAVTTSAGAGNIYASLPVILSVGQRSGAPQYYALCMIAHKVNVPVGDATQPNPNWYLARATVQTATSLANAASRSSTVCNNAI